MGVGEGWRDAPAGGRARATGGGRVRVGSVGSDWWGGSYWGRKRGAVCIAERLVSEAPEIVRAD